MIKKMTSCVLINECLAQPSSGMLPHEGDENKYRNPQPIYKRLKCPNTLGYGRMSYESENHFLKFIVKVSFVSLDLQCKCESNLKVSVKHWTHRHKCYVEKKSPYSKNWVVSW